MSGHRPILPEPGTAGDRHPAPNSGRDDPVAVVAAVVRRRGRYLVCRRPAHKRHGGLWEFPGGKVRPGESWLEAANRELAEELALTATWAGNTLWVQTDPGSPFVVHFLEIAARGEPEAREHDELRWCTPQELALLPMAPADAVFVKHVALGGEDKDRRFRGPVRAS